VLLRAFPSGASLSQLCDQHLSTITFVRYPELVFLLGPDEPMASLLESTPAQILLRWVNFLLPPGHVPVANLGDALSNGTTYVAVCHRLFPSPDPSPPADDADANMAHVVQATRAAGIAVNVQPADLREGDELFNAIFLAHWFHASRGGLLQRHGGTATSTTTTIAADIDAEVVAGPEEEAKAEVAPVPVPVPVPADVIPEPPPPSPPRAATAPGVIEHVHVESEATDAVCDGPAAVPTAAVAAPAPVLPPAPAPAPAPPEGGADGSGVVVRVHVDVDEDAEDEEEEAVLKQWINSQRFGDLRIDDRYGRPHLVPI